VSKLPDIVGIDADHLFHEQFYMALARRYLKQEAEDDPVRASSLPSDVPVSIVLATYDRPEELRECLASLFNQDTERCLEIIVVDNNPSSGLTTRVISDFPGVVLVRETRKGLSYARNAGIAVSRGDIIIATDDDVIMPRNWLEKLVAPFSRSDVMVVTGNVLPHELETEAQQLFEMYGGLGRGFERREVDKDWFDSFRRHAVPTWTLGATANAAFSSTIFSNPQIGLMCEALGPGMPSGVGEDTYLFYKVIKAGQKIVYEPEAYVWHKHRRGISDLRNQIYNYSKGHVAYHLTTLIRDNDLRALVRLLVEMPRWHIWRIKEWLRGRMKYPLPLILLEIKGYIVGPWALWRSCRRVKREGRSESVVTSGERLETPWKQIAETEPE
jgi:glycosyltransferase involved in cell wall biosynthesis